MASLKKSLFYSAGERYLNFGIQFVSSIIIARLLTPLEIGIFSVGSIILSFSHIFRDIGISNYIIQEASLTEEKLQTAQTLLFIASWSLAAILWLASSHVASFYAEPGVGEVIQVLSINFLILPFGALASALLRRDMRFDSLFKINTSAAIVHALTAIGLSSMAFGFISLAWAGVAGTITTVALTAYYSKFRVALLPTLSEFRHVMTTAGRFSGASLLNECGQAGPELIVGKMMSLESTAFLGRAQGIVGLFSRTIVEGVLPVLVSHFAQTQREQKEVGTLLLATLGSVSAVVLPIFACLYIVMDSAITLLYGTQWKSSVEPARILCIGAAGMSIAWVINSALSGMGKAKDYLRGQLFGQPTKLVLVVVGTYYSISHVASAIAFGDILILAYMVLISKKITAFKWKAFIYNMAMSGSIAACAAIPCFAFKSVAGGAGNGTILTGCAFASALGWLLGIVVTRHSLGRELLKTVRMMRK